MIDGDGVVDVSEYASALRRWWPYIAIAAAIGLVLGAIAGGLQNAQYESEAIVEVRPLVTNSDDPDLDVNRRVNTATEQAIAGSQRVAERALALIDAAEALGTNDYDTEEVEAAADALLAEGSTPESDEATRAVIEQIEAYRAAGADGVNIALRAPWSDEAIDAYLETVLPTFS